MKNHVDNIKAINTLTLFLIVIFLITGWLPLIWFAIFLLVISTFNNRLADTIAQGWIGTIQKLGKLNTAIVLSLVFYLVLTPLAIFFRLANKKKVDHFLRNTKESYFETVDKHFSTPDFERPW